MIQTIVTLGIIVLLGAITACFAQNKMQDEYEKEFERRTRGQFAHRFEMDSFTLRHHND